MGAEVRCFDPAARAISSAIRKAEFADSVEASCEGAELLLVLTEWDQFSQVHPSEIGERMTSKRVIDCRNILDPDMWTKAGFQYHGIGRSI